jgi:hypothetical protein
VRDHFSRGVSLGKIRVLGQPTIIQIVFTTIRELDRACGERYFGANYPADLPICYVKLSGTFRVFGPPGLGVSPAASTSTAFILIEARTGNATSSSQVRLRVPDGPEGRDDRCPGELR